MQEIIVSLVTLTILEIVLGIDNIIFISILSNKLPQNQHKKARNYGLIIGMIIRVIMLLGINWVQQQENDLFIILGNGISGKDLLLIGGGLFLLYQSVHEIHLKMKGVEEGVENKTSSKEFSAVLLQMGVINIVFSLDSVITAIGMANHVWVMITAVVISMIVMLVAAGPIASFVNQNPSIKILALAFLVLIGVSLLAEGLGQHLDKGYIYFAMAFSFTIELINLRLDKQKENK
ncbi:MAG: TerC family protein [Bacteroidetes bacterium]|nr:TerC family protein [Bacteroidota bacterium]